MSLKRDLELLYEIGCFRFINRVWVQLLAPNFANNAEHSMRKTGSRPATGRNITRESQKVC